MNNPKFQLFKSSVNGQFYYRPRASNGEPILSGEGYFTKQSCQVGIASAKANAPYDFRYDRSNGINNYTFNLKGVNGEVIGRSENYPSAAAREVGITAVKRIAPACRRGRLGLVMKQYCLSNE